MFLQCDIVSLVFVLYVLKITNEMQNQFYVKTIYEASKFNNFISLQQFLIDIRSVFFKKIKQPSSHEKKQRNKTDSRNEIKNTEMQQTWTTHTVEKKEK